MARSARNPWVAMDVATDPVAHARLLSRAHERELLGARTPSAHVRELVLSSWRRGIAAGVAPDQVGAPVSISGDELDEARERSPLAPAIGLIQSTLSSLDQALEGFSDSVQQRFPGDRFELVGQPETVGNALRASWQFGPVTGTDFALLDQGKVRALYAFVRPPGHS